MPYSSSVPINLIEPLAWLGKTNWISLTKNGYSWSRGELQAILNKSVKYGRMFSHEVRNIINMSVFNQSSYGPRPSRHTMYSDSFLIQSQALATGQKTIQLSQEWCEAFENTELTLQFNDYRQPFPTMVIEFPSNYAEAKYVPGSGDYPEYIVLHSEEQKRVILVEVVFHNKRMTTQIPFCNDEQIESVLGKLKVLLPDNSGFDTTGSEMYIVPFLRIAFNAMIAMTYGTKWEKLEYTNPERKLRVNLKKQSHSKDKAVAMKARLLLGKMPQIYRFDQNIKAFEDKRTSSHEPTGQEGTPKKVHWRRGHWRQQAVGEGRIHHELRWIRPILINGWQFRGNLKDTATTYTTT